MSINASDNGARSGRRSLSILAMFGGARADGDVGANPRTHLKFEDGLRVFEKNLSECRVALRALPKAIIKFAASRVFGHTVILPRMNGTAMIQKAPGILCPARRTSS